MIRVFALVVLCGLMLGGCETTREKSARMAKNNKFKLGTQHGVNVKKTNREVKVVETTVLKDDFGQAAVVVMKIAADHAQLNVPIELSIKDKSGKQLFRNDTGGLDAALTGPAALPARGEAFWVYDQLRLTDEADEIVAQVGKGQAFSGEKLPEFKIIPGEIERDPDGIMLNGKISGASAPAQRKLVIYGIARRSGKIVAAGTAQLEKLTPQRRSRFQMYFVGDPSDADIEFFVPPTTPR